MSDQEFHAPGEPDQKLDPKAITLWRLTDTAGWGLLFLIIAVAVQVLVALGFAPGWEWVAYCGWAALAVSVLVTLFVVPPIRYGQWRYSVNGDYLETKRGIIWHRRTVVPFIRVQNTDTNQGPLMRLLGLSAVSVSTAAGQVVIPGLSVPIANELRDKAAELARVAREDV